jgi:hypothetical protein
MKAQFTKKELETLVAVALDGTGISPKGMPIHCLIPDCILDSYEPLDVLRVAHEYRFVIDECRTCGSHPNFKANGKWVQPDEGLAQSIKKQENLNHSSCDKCYFNYVGYNEIDSPF